MPDPALPVQSAIVAQLGSDARINNLVANRVFDDELPQNPPDFPYVVVGTADSVADFADDYDGSLVHVDVHVWSREPGFTEAKTIGSALRDVLDLADVAVDGFNLVGLRFEGARYLYDPDGVSKHGVISFLATVEPTGKPN